jgi:hypothetical protein
MEIMCNDRKSVQGLEQPKCPTLKVTTEAARRNTSQQAGCFEEYLVQAALKMFACLLARSLSLLSFFLSFCFYKIC